MNAREFFGAMFDPLKRMTDFSGRSTRAQFWPFIFLYYIASQVASLIAITPFMNRVNALSAAQAQGEPDPEAFAALFTDGEFGGMFTKILLVSIVLALLFLIPLAGAVTRRLHDTNRSGFWALPSLIFLASGLFLMLRLITPYLSHSAPSFEVEDISSTILPIFANNVVYLICVITLIVFCVQDGTVGANRYGEDPKGRDPEEEAERTARYAETRKLRERAKKDPTQTRAPARLIK
jgi:uncharacterized membrane protein YhaH (DUF805 family)